ncbi:hypothetical protein Tcan_03834 [Toxocara canis]|uniref:Uncharacterized protein n=1 Tax=Toxocara canis TaxID=6265 RepID=A0A0B2VD74_TOXCA|nr:hypothetical protein Tcan_03834 [Toxocara canis]
MTERFLTKLKLVGAIGTKESTNAYHDFAWCLDACVRDKNLDAQQTSKLKNILELAKKSPPEMACRDPRAHLITHRVVQPAPFDNPLSNEEAANCFINEYMMNGLDIRAGIKCHLLRIVNLLGAVIGEQRVRLIMDRISP